MKVNLYLSKFNKGRKMWVNLDKNLQHMLMSQVNRGDTLNNGEHFVFDNDSSALTICCLSSTQENYKNEVSNITLIVSVKFQTLLK